jgi:hypothetical protein
MRRRAIVGAVPAWRQCRGIVRQNRDLELALRGPTRAGWAESARQRLEVLDVPVNKSYALVTDRDDSLGELVDGPLVVRAVILKLHDPVEAISAVALTQEVVIELHRLGDMRDPAPVDSCPESWHNGVDYLTPPRFVSDLTAGKCEPFPAAGITLEIAP